MKWRTSFLLIFLLFILQADAQTYHVSTQQNDAFSISLIDLMNSAPRRFQDQKGDLNHRDYMSHNNYELKKKFPGSAAAVIRESDQGSADLYIEFGGFDNMREVKKSMKELLSQVQRSLGDRVYPKPGLLSDQLERYFMASISVRDDHGFFSSNISLMSGSSNAPVYLYDPNPATRDSSRTIRHFILIKISGGTPGYQYFIPGTVKSDDPGLEKLLKELIDEAPGDFERYRRKKDSVRSRKKDTLQMGDHTVFMNYRGEQYSATIILPDSKKQKIVEGLAHQVIQAAAGDKFVYHVSDYSQDTTIVYYRKEYNVERATIYLGRVMQAGAAKWEIRVMSPVHHAVPRHRYAGED